MSIKQKTIILLLVSLLITGLVIGGAGMFTLYRQAMGSTEISMHNQTIQLAAQINELFDSFNRAGDFYSQDSDLRSGDPTRIQGKLNTYFGVANGVDRLNFLDPTGKRIAIAPFDAKILGDSLADRKFYKDTIADQKSHVSDIIISRATGDPSVIVTQPVKNENNQLAGIVLQAVNIKTLNDFLAQVKVGSTGIVAIVAPDGTLLVHSNTNLVKEQKKIPAELMARFQEHIGQLIPYTDLSGRDTVALSVPIKNTGWFAVICLPTSEFMNGFYTRLFLSGG